MDIYQRTSRWKIYLAIGGIIIVLISMIYTNHLASQIAEQEKKTTQIWTMAQEEINDLDDEDYAYVDVTLHNEILLSNTNIPVILVNERGGINAAINFGEGKDDNEDFLKNEVKRMQEEGFEPIEGYAVSIYYQESKLLTQLRYFPYIQLLLISAFILFGYLAFNSARRAEQNRVWVGMAKETAHQLGTPISAILAWMEHLKMIREDDNEVKEVVQELTKDVDRLELIAERFSKIGSEPKLETIDVYEELEKCRSYMAKRAPRKVSFHFPKGQQSANHYININPPLFDWVVENLLRNALDAMEGKGQIRAEVYTDKDFVYIDISDTGKGIPAGKFKTVFQPGFTTKKRGWGLGLSLAKRIIEQYHSGKIFVKKSAENSGTTFTIQLPKGNLLMTNTESSPQWEGSKVLGQP
ncbi:MAG: two-component sensor histidine kinase [Saprospiraceae bacterium]|nr:MAG: two-component sensor histidine kinase [Saprospiraceae bacterium]